MFRKYGLLGILLIVFVEINFLIKIEPFAHWYFPIVWVGYILVIDALVYMLNKNSLISNRPKIIVMMFILSAIFWWVFEWINVAIGNWSYSSGGLATTVSLNSVMATIAFATVVPAVAETYELLRTIHFADKVKLKKKHNISKPLLYGMMLFGLFSFIAPIVYPRYFFPLVWVSFFFILDPVNYLTGRPSLIKHFRDKQLKIPLSVAGAGLIAGLLWEFWNYWAVIKWHYNVPFVGFLKIFEMPILGYLGYIPFAFELFAMYHFSRGLLEHKQKLLKTSF